MRFIDNSTQISKDPQSFPVQLPVTILERLLTTYQSDRSIRVRMPVDRHILRLIRMTSRRPKPGFPLLGALPPDYFGAASVASGHLFSLSIFL